MIGGIGSTSSGYTGYLQNQGLSRSDSSEMFDITDTDKSGGISESELSQWTATMSEETGIGIDASSAFAEYDIDEDGKLGREELESLLTAGTIGSPGATGGSDESNSAAASDAASSGSSSSALSEYDTNEDGVLSSAEFQAYLDDLEEHSTSSRMREAISNYAMNSGNDDPFNLRDAAPNTGGIGAYSPIDIPA